VGRRTHYEPGLFCAVGLAASDRAAATVFLVFQGHTDP
jgi:hypothetical protein